jgi:hypothetical protein
MAETVGEACDLFSWFSHERSDTRIHSLGFLHIGGDAYFVWAFPPNFG